VGRGKYVRYFLIMAAAVTVEEAVKKKEQELFRLLFFSFKFEYFL
jgi:hypothetical protein